MEASEGQPLHWTRRWLCSRRERRGRGGTGAQRRTRTPRGAVQDTVETLKQAYFQGYPESAGCVQGSIDSRNSAIHSAYRISLRPSSLFEPRHPSLKVVSLECVCAQRRNNKAEFAQGFERLGAGQSRRGATRGSPNPPKTSLEENTDDRRQPFCDPHSKMHVDLEDSCE